MQIKLSIKIDGGRKCGNLDFMVSEQTGCSGFINVVKPCKVDPSSGQ